MEGTDLMQIVWGWEPRRVLNDRADEWRGREGSRPRESKQ